LEAKTNISGKLTKTYAIQTIEINLKFSISDLNCSESKVTSLPKPKKHSKKRRNTHSDMPCTDVHVLGWFGLFKFSNTNLSLVARFHLHDKQLPSTLEMIQDKVFMVKA